MSYIIPTNANLFVLTDNYKRRGEGADGTYYQILPNHLHIFQWVLVEQTKKEFIISHTASLESSQNLSIRAWFSMIPLDEELFISNASLNPISIPRLPRSIILYDESILHPYLFKEDKTKISLAPGTYFFNIQNLQNRDNSYRLIFK